MPTHVFIDNSNVFLGAQRAAAVREAHFPRQSIRVHYRSLFALVEGGRTVATRVLAGSVPPGNDELWGYARDCGYDTDLLRRVESDDGRLVEQGVDEMLHLKIANILLDLDERPQTLVLVTGDGKLSAFGTSFPLQTERALKRGWQVEVWSWREQLSKVYARIVLPRPGDLVIRELDRYYPSITFVRAGEYAFPDAKRRPVAARPVRPFVDGIGVAPRGAAGSLDAL